MFHISLDSKAARFLSDLSTWTSAANRGFTDDDANYTDANTKMTATQKSALLTTILGSVACYAPVLSPGFIKQKATSLSCIWDRLKAYYGFRRMGSRITELMEIKMHSEESREALYERLYAFLEDYLLRVACSMRVLNLRWRRLSHLLCLMF